ncbi:MAG: glycine cleavage system aminomethyltransferase GcvT [Alloprevotella sp.]|nr:glycine cleavage system aminomethyltransferase GcvT [Alloprevotella sp.]
MDKITCLHDKHVALGANMVPFGGFDMPLYYKDITTEHNAVRGAVGLFDVSHMGEVRVKGPEAEKFVQHIFTNDVAGAEKGKIFYGMMLYPNGGTVDDLLVYKMGENDFLLVINAANIDKDYAWMQENIKGFDATADNQSDYYGQLAIQGPGAEALMQPVLGLNCADLVFYTFKEIEVGGETIIVSRTGYTGEDGFEVYGSHEYIRAAWDKLIAAGVQPCGLGCRDTLRFEVGLPLYGDELTEDISPVMAALSMFVKLDKEEFIGKEACAEQKANGIEKKVVGIELQDKGIPRHGYPVCADGKEIGYVTTGYKSICTGKSVCMALIDFAYSKLDTPVDVMIHGKARRGIVCKKRFYQKSYKK